MTSELHQAASKQKSFLRSFRCLFVLQPSIQLQIPGVDETGLRRHQLYIDINQHRAFHDVSASHTGPSTFSRYISILPTCLADAAQYLARDYDHALVTNAVNPSSPGHHCQHMCNTCCTPVNLQPGPIPNPNVGYVPTGMLMLG